MKKKVGKALLILIIGGSASGKSELAEAICGRLSEGRKAYIATMDVRDAESERRIAKHRKMREGGGFETVEHALCGRYSRDSFKGFKAAILECVSNLLANEMYIAGESAASAEAHCVDYIMKVSGDVAHTVVVSNDIFGDGADYDASTLEYIGALGNINRILARKADAVIEAVCGIPVFLKGADICPEGAAV